MSKRELVAKIREVKREIEELERITSIGNLESFELIVSKIKEDIIRNINEEDFKAAKNNMAKINKMRDFTDYIEKTAGYYLRQGNGIGWPAIPARQLST